VALRTVIGKPGVTAGNLPRIEKCFATACLKKQDTSDPGNDGKESEPGTRQSPRISFAIVTEISFVAFGDLFLRSAGRGHARRYLDRGPGRRCELFSGL